MDVVKNWIQSIVSDSVILGDVYEFQQHEHFVFELVGLHFFHVRRNGRHPESMEQVTLGKIVSTLKKSHIRRSKITGDKRKDGRIRPLI